MKKIVALFTAVLFALSLGVAFAQETAAPAPAPEKKAEAPMHKTKKAKKAKKAHKAKKAEKKAEAPAAAPEAK
jgi:hypothetical protein